MAVVMRDALPVLTLPEALRALAGGVFVAADLINHSNSQL